MSEDARQDAVRRLLAESRHDQPMPPEVAQRLDTLLGELVDARSQQDRVVTLAAGRRRRQRAQLFLAAAAAVVVVGVAGVAVPQLGGSDGGSGSASESAADSTAGSAGGSASSGELPTEEQGAAAPRDAADADQVPAPDFAEDDVAVIGVATAEADIASVVRGPGSPAFSSDLTLTGIACGAAAYGAGRLVPAVYDDAPAVLAIRPARDGVRIAELLACGTAEVLRAVTVPEP